jgi:hypothetical protein
VSLGKDNSYPLAEALVARGLPFALATGYGRDGVDPRYREQATLYKPFELATFRGTVDQLMVEKPASADGSNASPHGPISATR